MRCLVGNPARTAHQKNHKMDENALENTLLNVFLIIFVFRKRILEQLETAANSIRTVKFI